MTSARDGRGVAGDDLRLEQLEQRMLLSGDGPTPTSLVWRGAELDVMPNSWVVTFDEAYQQTEAERAGKWLARRLGVGLEGVQLLGSGFSAKLDLDGHVRHKRVDRILTNQDWLVGFDPNVVYQPMRVPNDPFFTQQWQHDNTGQFVPGSGFGTPGADANMREAWDITIGSRDVIVAVIDTGVEIDHPDLRANIWTNPGEIPGNGIDDDGNGFVDDVHGWDFGDLDNNPDDDSAQPGHGTAVAGTIGAVGNNGVGVTGVAWNVSILPMKIADRFGSLSLAAIVGANDYLTMMRGLGHNIVASNNSYGTFAPDFWEDESEGLAAERAAIERFIDSGGVFVAAAGNSANDNDESFTSFPASYDVPGIVAVAATDNNDGLAGFSNYGDEKVDLAAPGQDILTTSIDGGYTYISGTSFSSPMVAGAVALLKTLRPNSSGEEIRQVLIDSSRPLPSLQGRVQSGGTLDVANALRIIGLDGPVVISTIPGPKTTQVGPDGTPLDTIVLGFNKTLNGAFLDESLVTLVGSGNDRTFGTGDDRVIPIGDVRLVGNRTVEIDLNLVAFLQQRLPIDNYRLTLDAAGFRDIDGNYLNGDASGGADEVIPFEVVPASGTFEPNDTLATAEPINFVGSGNATFTGLRIGDGVQANLDVDLFKITVPRGGLIRAEVIAQNRPGGSELDGYLRLFDANGVELTANDQFRGADPLVDFFVTTGGIYYVGVSGFPNTRYNPNVAGSGQSQSRGIYDLSVTVDLVQDDRVTVARDHTDQPMRLPPVGTQGTLSDSILLSDARAIKDLNVRLDVVHDFVGDLRVSLIAPDGTEVLLANRVGGSGNDFNQTLFDDEATVSITDGTPPFDRLGGYRPVEALSKLDGKSASGLWTLVIQDQQALNSGFLLGWSLDFTLRSDIFGEFELNDTIPTARRLDALTGGGSTQFQATLGDGAFGARDVDIFEINAVQGQTLSASAVSHGTVDTALVLFNSNGDVLRLVSPASSRNAQLSNFTFASSGRYYLAVTEAANTAFDPFEAASGTDAATTGDYTLSATLATGVSDRARVFDTRDLAVGAGPDGTFGTGGTGIELDGMEFLFDDSGGGGSAMHFYGASARGATFRNDGLQGDPGIPIVLTDHSDSRNRRMVAEGPFNGLHVSRSIAWAEDDRFIAIDVRLRNTTPQNLTGVTWMEALNPEQGLNHLQGTTAATVNDVVDGNPFALASFFNNAFEEGLSIALAAPSADDRAIATFFDPSMIVRDPTQLLDLGVNDPNGAAADLAMGLAYDLGSLASGEEVALRYFVLLGRTQQSVLDLYDAVENGTGAGHLTADPANPANENLQVAPGDPNDQAPTLPFRQYYPEGFANRATSTFLPIVNPHDQAVRVVILARYETGARDEILADQMLQANARGGITITTPELFENDQQLVRKTTPYALEVRSELPVMANFSHYDLFLLDQASAVGEALTNRVDTTWTFGEIEKAQGVSDFVLFQNTTEETIKVTSTFYPTGGGTPIAITQELAPLRRGGMNIRRTDQLPAGKYGLKVEAEGEIVAVVTHFDGNEGTAYGARGVTGLGGTRGAIPEGQVGLNATGETIGILNATGQAAEITFSFIFESGTAYRTLVNVNANRRAEVDVASLANFPAGEPYSVFFESTVPVTMTLPTKVFGDEFAAPLSDQAYTLWGFGEGFRPRRDGKVTEYLRLFNPASEDVLVEITMHFDGGLGEETFRRVIPARRVADYDVHEFVTGDRRNQQTFYGITVKAAEPIVAYMGHFDSFFPGGFGTLGTPLGIAEPV